jgi:hypothetical protein
MGANRNTNPPVTPPPTPRWASRPRNSDAMEVDQVQLQKLSPKERQYLIDNQGCFRCRAVGVDHDHFKNCPRFNNQQAPRVSTLPKTPANDRPRRLEEIDGQETTSQEEGDRYNDIDVATPIQAEINHKCHSNLQSCSNTLTTYLYHPGSKVSVPKASGNPGGRKAAPSC